MLCIPYCTWLYILLTLIMSVLAQIPSAFDSYRLSICIPFTSFAAPPLSYMILISDVLSPITCCCVGHLLLLPLMLFCVVLGCISKIIVVCDFRPLLGDEDKDFLFLWFGYHNFIYYYILVCDFVTWNLACNSSNSSSSLIMCTALSWAPCDVTGAMYKYLSQWWRVWSSWLRFHLQLGAMWHSIKNSKKVQQFCYHQDVRHTVEAQVIVLDDEDGYTLPYPVLGAIQLSMYPEEDARFYITNYIAKKKEDSLNVSILFTKQVAFHRQQEKYTTEIKTLNKQLMQQCANTLSREQEFSLPEVSSYLCSHGDRYISHFYMPIYLDAFGGAIRHIFCTDTEKVSLLIECSVLDWYDEDIRQDWHRRKPWERNRCLQTKREEWVMHISNILASKLTSKKSGAFWHFKMVSLLSKTRWRNT